MNGEESKGKVIVDICLFFFFLRRHYLFYSSVPIYT